jgi:hypothetical protein
MTVNIFSSNSVLTVGDTEASGRCSLCGDAIVASFA